MSTICLQQNKCGVCNLHSVVIAVRMFIRGIGAHDVCEI